MCHTLKVWHICLSSSILDSLTHIVLGACIGEVIAGKQLGKKAMLIGAIANSLPDIDIVASLWLDHATNLLAHRGITHSFLFLLLISPALAWLCQKCFKVADISFGKWSLFWGVEIFIHLLIDSFTAYGTGLFEPFSNYRVSLNTVFVLDPLFTIGPLIGFIALLIMKRTSLKRNKWATAAIILCVAYTGYCFANKVAIDKRTKQAFTKMNLSPDKYFTTPTPANNLLWYIVAAKDTGYYIGYRSMLDKKENIDFHYVLRNDSLLNTASDKASIKKLKQFSEGYYVAELLHDSLFFSDMRFGEMNAWMGGQHGFIFSFCLQNAGANDNVLQRRRMAIMDKKALQAFWHRILGE